ncbi:MAG: putative sugar nucleotidyl transferase [Candidatus Krumholzibacteria bacterium]|nr:putative sugar nucleotidyl transferase [Candidatus Krumholzibacteria bacterium]
MKHFACIFEDKKFSNFFPLSLSLPVFELRIGSRNFRSRLQMESGAEKFGVLCRDYLGPLMALREPALTVNEPVEGDTVFLNGRLLCYGDELSEVLNKIPENGIAVKGGYVVAAKLVGEGAKDFAAYIRGRISETTIEQLCAELKGYVNKDKKASATKSRKNVLPQDASEGTYEDDHALGQDSLVEKLPQPLLQLIDQHNLTRLDVPEARLLSFPWQIVEENPVAIDDDFQKSPFRGQSEESVVYPGVQMVGEENIVVGEAAVVRPGVVLDASAGPIMINDGTTVMPNACLLGPVYVGNRCIIKSGAKILEGTSIGDVCKVGGEVDQAIFSSYSNKQHDGFIGHSYVGEWVNIGAGTNNSDLKNNYSAVRMWCAGEIRQTGRQFLGLIMGDHSKTGIGTLFNSGTVVGFNCNVYSSELVDRFVPSYSWGQGHDITNYELEKAMLTAQVVMERRGVKFDPVYKNLFHKIFELTKQCDRNI